MGQAKRRGTFEERKAQAIARDGGDDKKPKLNKSGIGVVGSGVAGKSILLGLAAANNGPMKRPLSGNQNHPPQINVSQVRIPTKKG